MKTKTPRPRKARNYAANDATLINVRALKKRVAELGRRVRNLTRDFDMFTHWTCRELESIRSFHDINSADMRKRITALESNMKKARRGR